MSIDQRRFPRVEFFLVPEQHEQLPVWVIKPEGLAEARGGVVVNLSEAGLQILAGPIRRWTPSTTSCACCWARTKACRCSAPMCAASGPGR